MNHRPSVPCRSDHESDVIAEILLLTPALATRGSALALSLSLCFGTCFSVSLFSLLCRPLLGHLMSAALSVSASRNVIRTALRRNCEPPSSVCRRPGLPIGRERSRKRKGEEKGRMRGCVRMGKWRSWPSYGRRNGYRILVSLRQL